MVFLYNPAIYDQNSLDVIREFNNLRSLATYSEPAQKDDNTALNCHGRV